MTKREAEQTAFEAISSHLNCAESVLLSARRAFGLDAGGTPTRVASGFGGGVGRSKEELCGALAGGIMAIGLAFGRNNGDESCDQAYDLTAEFRKRFILEFGTSTCGELLQCFGKQEHFERCRLLVARTAGILFELMAEAEEERTACHPG